VLENLAQKLAHRARRFIDCAAGLWHLDREIAIIRQLQFALQYAAIGVRVGAHPPRA
jgi:hypothetical protein